MKRGKDEEKITGPLFPRLHVKDTEKGWPKAPPRNKMAIYEQVSIPSQRFSQVRLPCNQKMATANLVHSMSQLQGDGNDRSLFFSSRMPPRQPYEKQYGQYSDSGTPSTQVERKKLDENDYRVPIFIHSEPSREFDKGNDMVQEKSAKETCIDKCNTRQECEDQQDENQKEFGASSGKSIPPHTSSVRDSKALKKQAVSILIHEHGAGNGIDRLGTDNIAPPERENLAAVVRRGPSNLKEALQSEDQDIVRDISNSTGSHEDVSCSSAETENLETSDCVSETSILDTVPGMDITPDDVVGIIGQKHFWEARRAIANQQRVFAVQIFELHRLIKVQKLIATSPQILLEDSAYLSDRTRKLPSKAIPNLSKRDSGKPTHEKECSAENVVQKQFSSPPDNNVLHSNCASMSDNCQLPFTASGNHNPKLQCYNPPHGHQLLVPVMSPTEGLIYKPYPGPGCVGVGQSCGPVSHPMAGNFIPPAYGVPQYQLPTFPPFIPHGYFPPYGMPILNTATFPGSSTNQTSAPALPYHLPAGEVSSSIRQKNIAAPNATLNSHTSDNVEVQSSSVGSPSEKRQSGRRGEGRNMIPLFPTFPAMDSSRPSSQVADASAPAPELPSQVIKVVPHNAISASESAARIFRSIQEERKQYDSI